MPINRKIILIPSVKRKNYGNNRDIILYYWNIAVNCKPQNAKFNTA